MRTLSHRTISEIRFNLAVSVNLSDEEIENFAATFWRWWHDVKRKDGCVMAIREEGTIIAVSPISIPECCENLFLWVIHRLKQGFEIVAAIAEKAEDMAFDWVKYFTPNPTAH